MKELRFTLVSDGSSDRALLPILRWLLIDRGIRGPIIDQWADLRRLRRRPVGLRERIEAGLDLYPCDLLFVHRDAETARRETRVAEIRAALPWEPVAGTQPSICVIPVRMTEAWLLFDEAALRRAAENPNGRCALMLPRRAGAESLPDPKEYLFELLRTASGLPPRRRNQLDVHALAHRVAGLIDDFSPLRVLPAFRALEGDVKTFVREHGWRYQ
jgi:hypothetical protein